jgi:hypothetical protein
VRNPPTRFILFVLIPGYSPFWPGALRPALWVAAFIFTGLGQTRPIRVVPHESSTGPEAWARPGTAQPGSSRSSMKWSGNLIAHQPCGACSTGWAAPLPGCGRGWRRKCHRRSPTCRRTGSPGPSYRKFSRRCSLPAFPGAALTFRPIAPCSLSTLWKDGFRSHRPFFGVECLTWRREGFAQRMTAEAAEPCIDVRDRRSTRAIGGPGSTAAANPMRIPGSGRRSRAIGGRQ